MKNFFYILSLIFIAAIVYSVMNMNFEVGLFSEDNLYQWLVIGAGICGLILSIIFVRYQVYKEKINSKT
ncbi:hypothetical protein GO491_00600 [Flavobacteriaceae bacterium Ap0902]|nr:hypothetical protein [Flavobacteriaceae bacterium Ap0902]